MFALFILTFLICTHSLKDFVASIHLLETHQAKKNFEKVLAEKKTSN